ncbi:deoxyribodipyrimidine photo-lyase [Salsuginibacillus halophilus]|uniref:Deoxyribodipyrimidine photo-lyase n=1 Tax=Salsuginibacillus halophilus TaxID=517424 RepID=A0A2P8HX73_9BACI|nr:deoxyribodipyrimidine photo-lyase [Salsuginibacillus halophilus]PSL50831.1 deoxyribodipyrimidine photo-lyase [Salsuginibacillus halophilus]
MGIRALWIRREFRFDDQPALDAMLSDMDKNQDEGFLFFQLDPVFLHEPCLHHDYFFHTLEAFQKEAEAAGIALYIIYGDAVEVIRGLLTNEDEITTLYAAADDVGYGKERDDRAAQVCRENGVNLRMFSEGKLLDPGEILKKDGGYYEKFTPYYKQWKAHPKPTPVHTTKAGARQCHYQSRYLRELHEKGSKRLNSYLQNRPVPSWHVYSEHGAKQYLNYVIRERLPGYAEQRDYLDEIGTTQLSPLIKTGRLSVRMIFHEVNHTENTNEESREALQAELAWRDFFHMVHYAKGQMRNEALNPKYQGMRWQGVTEEIEAWKEGRTGVPLIDAAMRQLKTEGWMPNRLRMLTASFFTKHMLADWREGEDHFRKYLIDYDVSSNAGGWQWAASIGVDPVPYFRIFNPYRQGERFDEAGHYVKKFVPELRRVEGHNVHDEKNMNSRPVSTYPVPMLDHKSRREEALIHFKEAGDQS